MKKICKGMAVFAIMVGLICMASCVSVGEIFSEIFSGGQTVAALSTQNTNVEYVGIRLESNGTAEAIRYSNSTKVKGKWESTGSTDSLKNGDTITITVEDKTVKGTVRQTGRKQVHETATSERGRGDYIEITYSVTLGAWGTYTYVEQEYPDDGR